MTGFRCNNCGFVGDGEPKTVMRDRADCSFGEVGVCPECGSDDLDTDEDAFKAELVANVKDLMAKTRDSVRDRLEYLRGEIEAERISYGEIAELQELSDYIEPGDVQLLQWAGVPEPGGDE